MVQQLVKRQQVKTIEQSDEQRQRCEAPEGSVQKAMQKVLPAETEDADAAAFDHGHQQAEQQWNRKVNRLSDEERLDLLRLRCCRLCWSGLGRGIGRRSMVGFDPVLYAPYCDGDAGKQGKVDQQAPTSA